MIVTRSYWFDGRRWQPVVSVAQGVSYTPALATRPDFELPVIDDEGTSWITVASRRETPYGVVRAWVWVVGFIARETIVFNIDADADPPCFNVRPSR